MRNSKPKFKKEIFKEVLLYVLNKTKKKSLDIESLSNIMYFIDFDFYEKYEESLTGAMYLK